MKFNIIATFITFICAWLFTPDHGSRFEKFLSLPQKNVYYLPIIESPKALASTGTAKTSPLSAAPAPPVVVKRDNRENLNRIPVYREEAVEAELTTHLRLAEFIESVKDEHKKGLIVGVFVPDVLAMPVVQQPANNLLYVSNHPTKVTQFRRAQQAGSIGLLAHNYLAGKFFLNLSVGYRVYIVYWDGSYQVFEVYRIEDYQALSLTSFRDLAGQKSVDQYTLFNRIYRSNHDRLVLQTCLEKDRALAWGRRFILAKWVSNS